MPDPIISVIIPAFRSGPLIKDAIESVLSQTFQNFEIIVVDNNASDDTRSAINEAISYAPEKIRLVYESIQGLPSARNRGLREARGIYIALLDDDDMMYSHRLEKQIEVMAQHPDLSLVYGMLNCVSYDGKTIVEKNKLDGVAAWSALLFGDLPRFKKDPLVEPRPSVIFFRKDLAVEAGLFDERFNPFWLEDTDFYLRMWRLGSFYCVPEPLTAYRLPSPEFLEKKRSENTSWMMARRNQNLFFSILVENYYFESTPELRKKFKKIQSRWLRELSVDIFHYHDLQALGRTILLRAMKADPFDFNNWKWFFRSSLLSMLSPQCFGLKNFPHVSLKELDDLKALNSFFHLPSEKL